MEALKRWNAGLWFRYQFDEIDFTYVITSFGDRRVMVKSGFRTARPDY